MSQQRGIYKQKRSLIEMLGKQGAHVYLMQLQQQYSTVLLVLLLQLHSLIQNALHTALLFFIML